jgi:nicotinate-nucleotide adenylyltransferase
MSSGAAGRIGVLGGTFDPIHAGHLAVATEGANALGLGEVLLVPSRTPPHRRVDPAASVFHRFAMVALAASSDERLVASDMELVRQGPSYTADTLRALQANGYPRWQIFFLIGADAFAEIATWRDYPAVLDLAQFVVCSRGGTAASSLPARLPALAARMIPLVRRGPSKPGSLPVVMAPGGPESGPTTRIFLLDCPTPDTSSTDIRARARAGRPFAGLVPPEVDSYIRRHGLYGAASGAAPGGRPAAGNLHE